MVLASNLRLLHIFPHSVKDPQQRHLGSTKDIRSRTEYFQERGVQYYEVVAVWRSDELLLKELKHIDLSDFQVALIELPLYPKAIHYIRQQNPNIRILTRPINAEFYHQLHIAISRGAIWRAGYADLELRATWQTLKNSWHRLRLDYVCSRQSDAVLSITPWEKSHYWQHFVGAERVEWLPYFLPREYSQAQLTTQKTDQCVCLTSVSYNPMLMDAVLNFARLVERLDSTASTWKFLVTGDPQPLERLNLPERVRPTGLLDSPSNLLAESRAMAVLSNLGFGFKTKILDAIQSQCYVLLPQSLFNRLPAEVQPGCIVVDLRSVDSFREALEQAKRPFPTINVNENLRQHAFNLLDRSLMI